MRVRAQQKWVDAAMERIGVLAGIPSVGPAPSGEALLLVVKDQKQALVFAGELAGFAYGWRDVDEGDVMGARMELDGEIEGALIRSSKWLADRQAMGWGPE